MKGLFTKNSTCPLRENANEQLRAFLEMPEESMDVESEKAAARYYRSCLDVNKTVEDMGADPLVDLLEKIGGWNISNTTR